MKLKWTNPSGHENSASAYTAAEHSAYLLRVDGDKVLIPSVTWAEELDLAAVPELATLPAGEHRIEIAVRNKDGVQSAFKAAAGTFSVAAIPNAPGNVSLTS